jgi:hypothetical protein
MCVKVALSYSLSAVSATSATQFWRTACASRPIIERRLRIGALVRSGAFPDRARDRDGFRVELTNRCRVAGFFRRPLGHHDPPDFDDSVRARPRPRASWRRCRHLLSLAELADERAELVERDAAGQGDALDPHRLQPANELAHRGARLAHWLVADNQLVSKQADDDGGVVGVEHFQLVCQRIEIARHDRMVPRIQLDAPQRRAEPAEEIVEELKANVRI